MAGQAILGETLLKQAIATATEEPARTVEALVAEHAAMVFRLAYSILRNHHDAEDAAQECFLRVVKFQKRLPQVRPCQNLAGADRLDNGFGPACTPDGCSGKRTGLRRGSLCAAP